VTLESRLTRGLEALGVPVPEAAPAMLLAYLQLLAKWNRQFNLTAVRDIEQMLPKHLLDSLTAVPYLRGARVLDIGSGAGLPGLPLAIVCPELEFTLLDSNGKKARFLRQAVHELALPNVTVVHGRVEAFHPDRKFDTLIARALAALPDMLTRCTHLLGPDTVLVAMKGAVPSAELSALPAGFTVASVDRVTVPGLEAERHIIVIRRGS
jgi:16S rRNA (guanine527-N7)-methyltransferase